MYYAVTRLLISELENSLVRFAQQGATTVDNYVSARKFEVKSIAANSIIKDMSLPLSERLDELKKQLYLDRYRRLSLADTEGNAVTTDNETLYIGDRKYFKDAMNGLTTVSDPIVSRVDGTAVICFAVPIMDGDKVTGVLYATYSADVLSLMTDKIKLKDNGSTFIINKDGDVIANDDRNLVYAGENNLDILENNPGLDKLVALEKKMVTGQTGTGEYYYNGQNRYMGYCPIGDTGWSIAVTAPTNEVFSGLNTVFVLLIVFILAGSLIIAVVLSHSGNLKKDLMKQQVNSMRITDLTNLVALCFKPDGTIMSTNRHAEDILLYFRKFGDAAIRNINDLLSPSGRKKLLEAISNIELRNSSSNLELALRRGESKVLHLYCSVISDNESYGVFELLGIDITDRVEQESRLQDSFEELTLVYDELAASEEKIRQQAYKDPLTDMPNRIALYQSVKGLFSETGGNRRSALLYLDLDDFKYINDSLGHTIGDLLLIDIGRRLKDAFTEDEIVARFEGDEFVVFIKDTGSGNVLNDKIAKAMGIFTEPFSIMDNNFHVSASCGISIYPDHAGSMEEMLKSSDVALFRAKKDGKNKTVMFEREMNDEISERISMENGLRLAIENNEFLLYYQPQVDLNTGNISGFEALIRWRDAERGMIPPLKFIYVAEETGLIVKIGRWVMDTACGFIKELNERTNSRFRVSVNISVVQLIQADFVETVKAALQETGLEPSLLELEITESKLVEALEMNLQKLNELRGLGVKLSIDDFGKGFSSLSYLKQLPVDTLKIDKSFVDDIPENDDSMIESIIQIGHQRKLRIVAEGVEKREQLEFLARYKCDMAQGYYYSIPLPGDEVKSLL
ncbi:MAG TPA: EAL domain-containing protein [Clostridia bacterium]|nr:EAL domain-containing protein [Clostridia bacterium]